MKLRTRSLIFRISFALLLLFILSVATVGFTLYELDLRKHDYVILNLTGRLSGIAQGVINQSLNFLRHGSDMQPALYREGLNSQLNEYSEIVSSLRNRLLSPELTGRADPLRCSWDAESIAQLNRTATAWRDFRAGLEPLLAAGSFEAAANHILAHEEQLMQVSVGLAGAFQHMMEGKLGLIVLFNQIGLGVVVVTITILMALLYFSFIRPLRLTMVGMERVSRGDFSHRVPHNGSDELGSMAGAFNRLTGRLAALFRLTERIDKANNLDETLHFVYDEFSSLLPLDWVGMLSLDAGRGEFLLERSYSRGGTTLEEGRRFNAEGSLLLKAIKQGRPLHITNVAKLAESNPEAAFAAALAADGRRSALFFPLQDGEWGASLVFAVNREAAYGEDHLELLGNIAAQVGHGLGKTVFTENLIISTLKGLAALAESRDPETGDHLLRMAIYSAMIAEELGREGPYQEQINPQFVRDIQRFAPMHDIGKVGIEDAVLLKPGRLDPGERTEMERHPEIGSEVLRRCEEQMQALGRSVFRVGIEIAEAHHEKFDGSGYPKGVAGEAIPLSARIVACADVFDALTSRRPYKEAWPVDKALELIREESGSHFDPEVVQAFERALPRVMAIYEQHRHV